MEFLQTIYDIITSFGEYIMGFFSYMIELAKSSLSAGNVALFVLFVLLIWKGIKKLI